MIHLWAHANVARYTEVYIIFDAFWRCQILGHSHVAQTLTWNFTQTDSISGDVEVMNVSKCVPTTFWMQIPIVTPLSEINHYQCTLFVSTIPQLILRSGARIHPGVSTPPHDAQFPQVPTLGPSWCWRPSPFKVVLPAVAPNRNPRARASAASGRDSTRKRWNLSLGKMTRNNLGRKSRWV